MKRVFTFAVLLGIATSARAIEFKPDAYKEVDASMVKTMPQDFYNKKVKITPVFRKFATPTPEFIEKQFDDRKYAVLVTTPKEWGLPIVVKKSGDLGEKVLAIQANSNLIVYGRIKKFRYKPKGPRGKVREFSRAPEYYIELQHIEITPASGSSNSAPRKFDKSHKGRKGRKRGF